MHHFYLWANWHDQQMLLAILLWLIILTILTAAAILIAWTRRQ